MCAYPSRHHTAPHPRQGMAASSGPERLARSRVTKTLQPGQPGTARWQHVYGEHLVCVRYREDLQANQRYVTVELVLEARPLVRQPPPPIVKQHPTRPNTLIRHDVDFNDPRPTPPAPWLYEELGQREAETEKASSATPRTPRHPQERVHVHIAPSEHTLRKLAQKHGAQWLPDTYLWLMSRSTAEKLGLQARIKSV